MAIVQLLDPSGIYPASIFTYLGSFLEHCHLLPMSQEERREGQGFTPSTRCFIVRKEALDKGAGLLPSVLLGLVSDPACGKLLWNPVGVGNHLSL